jgi:hypothetical protein
LSAQGCDDERARAERLAGDMPAVSCSLVWQMNETPSQYTLKFTNLSDKPVKSFEWKYLSTIATSDTDWVAAVFYEKDFILPANQAKEFIGSYSFPPGKSKLLRGILNITRIDFVDGSQWIRQELKDTAYNRASLLRGLSKMED